ncbi:hypothetical protein Tco_0223163 [Tanacetum coccineum]
MLDDGDNWGIDPLEFISRVNSSFDKHMKIDGRTKTVLFHAWMNGSWNKRRMDDSILSRNKTTIGSFFKPYLITRRKSDTEKEDEQNAAIRNQGASIKTLEIQIEQISKVLQERGFGSLPSSTDVNPRDQVKSISTTIEADSYPIRRIGSSQYAISTGQNRTLMYITRQMMIPFPSRLNGYYCEEKKGSYGPKFSKAYSEASHINNSIPRKEKDPGVIHHLSCF